MDASRKAEILLEAVPAIVAGRARPAVIKLGGSAMEDADALAATMRDVAAFAALGFRPVLVHGGGKPIDRAMAAANLTPRKIQGRRYTDDATLEIVVRVLTTEINADLVRRLKELGTKAVGLHSGKSQALHGERLTLPGDDGKPIDLGRVGEVTRVDGSLIEQLTGAGVVPVIPSLAHDAAGGWLNVNADTAAAAVAVALKAERLVVMSDTPGVLRDINDPYSRIPRLNAAGCSSLIADGTIAAGMIPKVESALACLRAGVGAVQLLDGRRRHVLLAGLFSGEPPGTEIVL